MKHVAHKFSVLIGAFILLRAPRVFAQPSAAATAAFNAYAAQLELRLAQQHQSANYFLAVPQEGAAGQPGGWGAARARLRSGELLIENLTPGSQPSGALVHHWRATAFVAKATPAEFERLLRDFSAYPHNFAPEVVGSKVLMATPTETLLRLRTRQHHVITVELDTTCEVRFASLDAAHGYSVSRSTRVDEVAPAGDEGLLYRLNTYWSWEERDGGLYLQLESLSLTRAIPRGLAWAVAPYVDSIPRDSLIFTLTSAREALGGKR